MVDISALADKMTRERCLSLARGGANNEVSTFVFLQKAVECLMGLDPADKCTGVVLDYFGLYGEIVSRCGSRPVVGCSVIGLGNEVGKVGGNELGKLVGAGERAARVLAFQVSSEFFELLNGFDNLRRPFPGVRKSGGPAPWSRSTVP